MEEKKEKKVKKKQTEKLELKEFLFQATNLQETKIKEILDKMYDGNFKPESRHIDKVLNVAFSPKDTEIYLPKGLEVLKKDKELVFKYTNATYIPIFCLLFALILFGFAAGTFFGVQVARDRFLNIDIDGDGVADINIDKDNDGVADVNIDTDGDRKPDLNIDYKANRNITFNYIINGEMKNKVDWDTDGDGKCNVNCDTNEDGWPDLNIDLNGDGKADVDIDTDGDGVKDLNLDTNNDGVCDINCDTNDDGVCDVNCIVLYLENNGGGSSAEVGDGSIDMSAVSLLVSYDNENKVVANGVVPDDEPGSEIPTLDFTVTNNSDVPLFYAIEWEIVENNYISDNFKYRVTSDNGGYNQDWMTAPKSNAFITSRVEIAPKTTQNYSVRLTLRGLNEPQNYDQGRTFNGRIRITYLGKVG